MSFISAGSRHLLQVHLQQKDQCADGTSVLLDVSLSHPALSTLREDVSSRAATAQDSGIGGVGVLHTLCCCSSLRSADGRCSSSRAAGYRARLQLILTVSCPCIFYLLCTHGFTPFTLAASPVFLASLLESRAPSRSGARASCRLLCQTEHVLPACSSGQRTVCAWRARVKPCESSYRMETIPLLGAVLPWLAGGWAVVLTADLRRMRSSCRSSPPRS